MSIATSAIGWGSYSKWEGPWFRGSIPFTLPSNPQFLDRVLATVTATEGGAYDAINAYDRCVMTVGVIQWGEVCTNKAVTRMLGACHDVDAERLAAILSRAGMEMVWRKAWTLLRDNTEDTRYVFLGGSSGLKGEWTPSQKLVAKKIAATIASVWEEEKFREAQLAFTRPKLLDFAIPFGVGPKALFAKGFDETGWHGALRAGYLSFAANLPAVAARRVTESTLTLMKSNPKDACIDLLRRLTFEPQVAIYPHRYDRIRPVLEKLFDVDLPDFSSELRSWKRKAPEGPSFASTFEIQTELVALGYDLGPSGADGKYGPKTLFAVKLFQKKSGLTADGIVGPMTLQALARARDARLAGA